MLYDRSSRITSSRERSPAPAAEARERFRNGRANAAATSATARARRRNRGQFRMRCRRTEWYGMRRRNMSDGNTTAPFRSRLRRCTHTGTAMSASPARNSGVRKASGISAPS
jgi:hypothetical protein